MLKKVISIVFLLCFIFSVTTMAENENIVIEGNAPKAIEQIPQGGRENMGVPPSVDMGGNPAPSMPRPDIQSGNISRDERPAGNFGQLPNNANNNGEIPKGQTDGNAQGGEMQIPGFNGQFDGQFNGQFNGQRLGGMGGFPGDMQNTNQETQEETPKGFWGFVKTYSTPVISVILLGLAFIFVVFYKRKNY